MRRSIATVSLSGTLEEKLRAAAAARFDAVEIFENDLLFFDGPARDVRRLAADLGLKIVLYQPFRDFEGVSDEQLQRNLDRAERKFDVMAELDAPLMLVCSNVAPQAIDDDARAAVQLRALAERAARAGGLRIGYEALAWGTRVNTWQHAWRLVDQAAHPHLGLVLDSFHTLAVGGDTAAVADIPGERIAFVQLADMPRLSMDLLSWSRHFRCFPGQGDYDVASFLAPILRAGYSGPLSLEVFNDDFRAAPRRAPTAVDGMRSLLLLEEQTRAIFGAPVPAANTRRPRVELFDPPPVPTLDGIAFVEVAVDDATQASLADLLGSLGFRRAGRHRSKAVSLFRQGAINFVLNAEPDSFAHSYMLMHGPAICALGLATPDPAQALARAEAFACTRFAGRVGPEEWPIPAIRALDGSLIYFVAEPESGKGPLETDFIAEPATAASDAGLLAVDHIAQALPDGQLESWILFYRAVLGLAPEAPFELNDPYGVVRSRTVASANRALRLPLNISQSPNTATARSVSTFAGAGVHHIALRSHDIFASARYLEQRAVKLLPIPANYYDDLAARLDLAPELIDELRRHNLLYDRSAAGTYFQLYTEPFADRFFFEIVQRVAGYDSYGAANAPVRMAAQALRRGRERADVLGLL